MTSETTVAPQDVALLAQVTGSPLEPKRLQTLLATGRSILEEIARLRSADLGDVHPAVIFDPTAPYRKGGR